VPFPEAVGKQRTVPTKLSMKIQITMATRCWTRWP